MGPVDPIVLLHGLYRVMIVSRFEFRITTVTHDQRPILSEPLPIVLAVVGPIEMVAVPPGFITLPRCSSLVWLIDSVA